ncbi:GntR family transcriptional regulator [Bacillus methanolicus PB1]|uniref:GntR family transcriptional regulator n=1 Tax=Bacillus methanolicus PB1 TaxID=997296 RepID=I3E0F6_BACMT|nr:GntR family transcriptional regulator [Bacillus methanolicus]EIJ79977.1 GntR family transcriptional regulator [Bacillus methanolicus PB1]
MFIKIEPHSDIPIYTQLSNQIIKGIACGILKSGNSLPSVRSLAADLGVNMHTVNKSYHELEKKGFIKIVPKSGAIINSPVGGEQREVHVERIVNDFRPIIAEALALGMNADEIRELTLSIISDIRGEKK